MKIQNVIRKREDLKIEKWNDIRQPCVYLICEKDGTIIYVGCTTNFYNRFLAHSLNCNFHGKDFYVSFGLSKKDCLKRERDLVYMAKPMFNLRMNPNKELFKTPSGKKKRVSDFDNQKKLLFKNIIFDAFKKKGINQSDFAKRLFVSRQRVGQILNGDLVFRGKVFREIERELEIEINL